MRKLAISELIFKSAENHVDDADRKEELCKVHFEDIAAGFVNKIEGHNQVFKVSS